MIGTIVEPSRVEFSTCALYNSPVRVIINNISKHGQLKHTFKMHSVMDFTQVDVTFDITHQ